VNGIHASGRVDLGPPAVSIASAITWAVRALVASLGKDLDVIRTVAGEETR
jgi:hypothetical protein